jgi:hypothetical protein
MCRKVKFEDSLARIIFNRFKMDCCMAVVTSKGVIKYRMFMIFLARNIFSRSNMDYCLADLTSERVFEIYSKLPFGDHLARNIFNGPNTGWLK